MSNSTLLQIDKNEARLGMFIHGFGKQWLRSPFAASQFKLSSPAELKALRESSVTTLVIDLSKGVGPTSSTVELPKPIESSTPPGTEATLMKATGMVRSIFSDAASSTRVDQQQVEAVVDVVDQLLYTRPASVLNLTKLKTKDEISFQHSVAVCALVGLFARHLKLDRNLVRLLSIGSLLHDIGKIRIPTAILTKADKLTAHEMAVMQTHPREGYAILVGTKGLPEIVGEICLHHHEKLDGSGYPDGLKDTQVGAAARIVAICDVFDALTSARPYKKGFTPEAAAEMMGTWSGHFDRVLLKQFFDCMGLASPSVPAQTRQMTDEMGGIAQADLHNF
ncbi:HD-GYP domain-containing protein [Mesorhizobium sp. CU2]|uniref:HD-GYP domain-containing protein n=1 Tax=unclassified Mesorhizobium TaxID=325217 RepID=UPI00112E6BF4|nr:MULTISPECIES: HD-GYP domain-containing protein [unclassified Mesorhizobium]TPN83769.1 HD-GYP domain-containing protein [Mesorhizobium sp. CU3]TPO20233.1 HD-GYP domain-containing protein [Mesorhizobium sp. CU2]